MDLKDLKSCVYGADGKEEIQACYDEYEDEGGWVRETVLDGSEVSFSDLVEIEEGSPIEDIKDVVKMERFWNFVFHGPIQEEEDVPEEVFEDVEDEIQDKEEKIKEKSSDYSEFYDCMERMTHYHPERRMNEENIRNCMRAFE